MTNQSISFILFMSLLVSPGCSSRDEIVEEPHAPPEWMDEMTGLFSDEERQRVRKAAETYVESQITGCVVRGISTFVFTGNLYLVGVDISIDDQRETVNLVARRFYPLDGGPSYWNVEPITTDFIRALSGYALHTLKREREKDIADSLRGE
jgi:hypothetical protein